MDQIVKPTNKIERLMTQLCPNGVVFKSLDELGTTYGGLTGKGSADFSNGNARFISYKNIFANLSVNLRANDFFQINDGEIQNTIRCGDVLFTGSSETPDEVGMSSVVLDEPSERIYLNSFCFGYRFHYDELLPGFSKYIFRSEATRRGIVKSASGVTRFNISKKRFLKVRIPIPPLEVQRDIVDVLDGFMELQAELGRELEAELKARRNQYAHYRDALLGFVGRTDVRWPTLGEIGEFIRGRRFTKADVVPDGIASIHYGEIYTHYGTSATSTISHVRPELAPHLRFARSGDVVIAAVGETVEDVCKAVAWLGEGDAAVHDDCFILRHSMNAKFVSYWFQTSTFHAQKNKYVDRAKVKRISGQSLGKITIPTPPIQEQERIVSILDKLDALMNDMSIELPAELAARGKQLEYYREKLLTFPEHVRA
jgi:type I restriction enzyme S subunit